MAGRGSSGGGSASGVERASGVGVEAELGYGLPVFGDGVGDTLHTARAGAGGGSAGTGSGGVWTCRARRWSWTWKAGGASVTRTGPTTGWPSLWACGGDACSEPPPAGSSAKAAGNPEDRRVGRVREEGQIKRPIVRASRPTSSAGGLSSLDGRVRGRRDFTHGRQPGTRGCARVYGGGSAPRDARRDGRPAVSAASSVEPPGGPCRRGGTPSIPPIPPAPWWPGTGERGSIPPPPLVGRRARLDSIASGASRAGLAVTRPARHHAARVCVDLAISQTGVRRNARFRSGVWGGIGAAGRMPGRAPFRTSGRPPGGRQPPPRRASSLPGGPCRRGGNAVDPADPARPPSGRPGRGTPLHKCGYGASLGVVPGGFECGSPGRRDERRRAWPARPRTPARPCAPCWPDAGALGSSRPPKGRCRLDGALASDTPARPRQR